MRNIFDQYQSPENRLTHSLVTALYQDTKLLKEFVRWISKSRINSKKIEIVQQQIPGDVEYLEEEPIAKGLPDAWIFDDEGWSLIIESKIAARLTENQVVRHYNTARSRGFDDVTILVIDISYAKMQLPDYVVVQLWSDIYLWLTKHSRQSHWAKMALEYFEVSEVKLVNSSYLKEGTLTIFSGVPFDNDEPYNYFSAKRLLKLAMEELRNRKDLISQLGIDPTRPGRGMITGKKGGNVWDYLSLKDAPALTNYPHFTLALEKERVLVIVTVPHQIKAASRRKLVNLGEEGFNELMERIARRLLKVLKKEERATPIISVVQRRYPAQSAPAILDARIEFDMRTAFVIQRSKRLPVKQQPQWLQATYDALSHKHSNLQMSVGAIFPYRYCQVQKSRELLDYVANTWIACKPLVDVLTDSK